MSKDSPSNVPGCHYFTCQRAFTHRSSIICKTLLFHSLGVSATVLSPSLSKTHTHKFPPPLPVAPISLICSSIIIILLLINHRDREGATLHLSIGTHCFPFSLLPFHHTSLICTLSLFLSLSLCLSLSPPLGSTQLLISTREHQRQSCPPGCGFLFLFFIFKSLFLIGMCNNRAVCGLAATADLW